MTAKIDFAHDLRGLASATVLVAHYVGTYWGRPKVVEVFINSLAGHPTNGPHPWLELFGQMAGQFGVALFFLVSGFVIPFSISRYSRAGFLAARVIRIWPVYIVGFSVTLLAYSMSSRYFGNPFGYDARTVVMNYALGLRDILSVPSIDGIVWTLEIELKFYLLCAVMAAAMRRAQIAPMIGVCAAMIAANIACNFWRDSILAVNAAWYARTIDACLPATILPYLFLGVLFNFLIRSEITTKDFLGWSGLLGAMFVAGCLLGSWQYRAGFQTMAITYPAAWCTFAAVYYWRPDFGRVVSALGDISYPLYVVHGLSGYVIIAVLSSQGWHPVLAVLAATGASIGVACGLHYMVERPSVDAASIVARWGRAPQLATV